MGTIIIILAAAIIGVGSVFVFHKDDNVVEEVAEEVIERELDLPNGSIDLSPKSKENKLA